MMTEILQSMANKSDNIHQYWNEQIKLKQKSGLSGAAYCLKHGIICSKYYYWENKLNSSKPKVTQLLPVKVNSGEPVSKPMDTKCTLALKGGHELRVHDQTILPLLISLLS